MGRNGTGAAGGPPSVEAVAEGCCTRNSIMLKLFIQLHHPAAAVEGTAATLRQDVFSGLRMCGLTDVRHSPPLATLTALGDPSLRLADGSRAGPWQPRPTSIPVHTPNTDSHPQAVRTTTLITRPYTHALAPTPTPHTHPLPTGPTRTQHTHALHPLHTAARP
jgi:hypothetical protein